MQWDRASEDVYIFTSDRYAQVNAALIRAERIGVVIDTLLFPSETLEMAKIARQHCPDGVRFVIYTGPEADHTYGAFLFPRAEIIAHEHCLNVLTKEGAAALQKAKENNQEFLPVRLRLPTLTFKSGSTFLRLPGKTIEIIHMPGHTSGNVSVLLHEEHTFFAGDAVMPIPTIARGDVEASRSSLERILSLPLEYIVQGHGDLILRGEIRDTLKRQIAYLDHLQNKVSKLVESGAPREAAEEITVESCGLPRVLLAGLAPQLHRANVLALYDRLASQRAASPARTRHAASESQSASAAQSAKRAASKRSTSKARTRSEVATGDKKTKLKSEATSKKSSASKVKSKKNSK